MHRKHLTAAPVFRGTRCLRLSSRARKRRKPCSKSLSASSTQIYFENKLDNHRDMFISCTTCITTMVAEWPPAINNDGLPDIHFTANSKGNNKPTSTRKLCFRRHYGQGRWPVPPTGARRYHTADVNGDGFDIYATASSLHHGPKGHNELFINNRNGGFYRKFRSIRTRLLRLRHPGSVLDYDHDGDLDCYLLNHSQKPNSKHTRYPATAANSTKYRATGFTATTRFIREIHRCIRSGRHLPE